MPSADRRLHGEGVADLPPLPAGRGARHPGGPLDSGAVPDEVQAAGERAIDAWQRSCSAWGSILGEADRDELAHYCVGMARLAAIDAALDEAGASETARASGKYASYTLPQLQRARCERVRETTRTRSEMRRRVMTSGGASAGGRYARGPRPGAAARPRPASQRHANEDVPWASGRVQ